MSLQVHRAVSSEQESKRDRAQREDEIREYGNYSTSAFKALEIVPLLAIVCYCVLLLLLLLPPPPPTTTTTTTTTTT